MARGIFRGIKDESEVAVVGTPHRIVFARNIRSVPKEDFGMLCNSIRGLPMGLTAWCREREREIVNRVQLDVKAAAPGRQPPPPTTGEQLRRRVYIRRSVEFGEVRVHGPVYRVPACKAGTQARGSK